MARTSLTVQDSTEAGIIPSYAAADATNDMMFINDGKTALHVKNGGAGAVNVTIVSVPCSHGRTADKVVNITAGAEKIIGPFDVDLFNQRTTNAGKVHVDFDADTSVTLAAIKL